MKIDEYFDEMILPKSEKEKRKEFAKEINEIMAVFLLGLKFSIEYGLPLNILDYSEDLIKKYSEVAQNYIVLTENVQKRIEDGINYILQTTLKDINEEYTLSEDRAEMIAENEVNSVCNYEEYDLAIEQGCTYKTWVTMKDMRVRDTHIELDEVSIPIEQAFEVGDSLMMFPRDESLNASADEIVNCRCSIIYE